jgi:GDP-L-fucose synthase
VSRAANECVFVAGDRGMVGSAIVRRLQSLGYTNILTASRAEVDLARQDQVEAFFAKYRIDQVYLAAAKVGGIHANNSYPAQFIYENLMVECNVIHSAHKADVQKVLLLGSSCVYPKAVAQPMRENALLTGVLEATNEPYAVAKIAGIKLCESYNREYGRDYRSVMPTNLYGTNDNFHPENSHVIPAMMRRFHEAVASNQEQVVIWGSGKPMREFLHVDDMAAATVHVMELPKSTYDDVTEPMMSHINVGTGEDVTIRELAGLLAAITGFKGQIVYDATKPDGTVRKLMDVTKLERLGWKASIPLAEGLAATYQWFRRQHGEIRSE